MSSTKFSVVKFLPHLGYEETVDVVPSKWLHGKCEVFWPMPGTRINTTREVMQLNDHGPKWPLWPIKFLHEYNSHKLAQRAVKAAQETSDIDTADGQTDLEKPRHKRKPSRFCSSELSDEDSPIKKNKRVKRIVTSSESEESADNIDSIRDSVKELLKRKPKIVQIKSSKKQTVSSPENLDNLTMAHSFEQISPIKEPELKKLGVKKKEDSKITEDPTARPTSNQKISVEETRMLTSPSSETSLARTISLSSCHQSPEPSHLSRQNANLNFSSVSKNLFVNEDSDDNTSSTTKNLYDERMNSNVTWVRAKKSTLNFLESPRKLEHDTHETISSEKMKELLALMTVATEQNEEICSKLDFLTSQVALLRKSINPDEEPLSRPKGLPTFPLKKEDDFSNMEKFLESDTNFNLTVFYLEALLEGIANPSKAAGLLLKKIIDNHLSRIISFGGTSGLKMVFSTTKLFECMNCAIKKRFKKCANLEEVKRKVQRWFDTSNQRKVKTSSQAKAAAKVSDASAG